jgi:hypothetical protein
MAAIAPLNDDYERRAYWQASMPALPDRSGRPLPASTDVVVIGGGYAGVTAARELARRGVAVTLLEARTLGWGASTRNGGIVHGGYKWSAGQLIKRYGQDTGRALYQETLDSYQLVKQLIAEEGIDCDFREVGHLELAYAPAHAGELEHARESFASVGVRSTVVPRERIHEEIGSDAYFGALVVEGSGLVHPGRYFVGLASAADRAGADLHEGLRAKRITKVDGGFDVETERGSIRPATSSWRRMATRTVSSRRSGVGSSRSGRTSSRPSPCRRHSPTNSRRRDGRSSTPRTSSITGTCRRIGGWCSAGGRRSCRPRSTAPPRSCGAACSRSIHRWQGIASSTHGAATSGSRSTGCPMSGGRRTASRTRWAAAGPGSH